MDGRRMLRSCSLKIRKGPGGGTRNGVYGNAGVSERLPDSRLVSRRQVRHLVALGPQSAIEDGDWYARNMYMQGSEQYLYHVETYGHPSKVGYKDVVNDWKAAKWDPTT